MSAMHDQDAQLRNRLALLEKELLALRVALNPKVAAAFTAAFDVVTVTIASTDFALPLQAIREIIQPVWCEPLPDAPDWVLGTFQYGRSVVPVVDIGRRLFRIPTALSPSGFYVLAATPHLTALFVTGIGDVMRVTPEAIAPPPADVGHAVFLTGTVTRGEGRMLPLLSLERLGREYALEEAS